MVDLVIIFCQHFMSTSLFSLHFIIYVVSVCITLWTDTSQQMSKAEDIDAGLSPVNSVLAICFVFNFELNKKDAMDRCKWRNVIKDVR